MRLLITTWGSRGDFQPYLALARGFQQADHKVKLAAPAVPEFSEAARRNGVDFIPLGPPMRAEAVHEAAERAFEIGDPLAQFRLITDELLLPNLKAMYCDIIGLKDWPELILSHFLQPAGRMSAERLRLPFVSGTLVPLQLPSIHSPPRKLPNLGSWSNRLLWKLAISGMNASWAGGINRVRGEVGLPPAKNLAGEDFYSPTLNLVGASQHVTPHAPDWDQWHHLTGYWFLEEMEWSPQPEVAEFFAQGPKPLVIGFGSMANTRSHRLTEIIVEAVKRSGVRAVIDPGWSDVGRGQLPDSVIRAEGVPHSWSFPRAAAVVHHGGAGTTAAAFKAGVPSVIVPHIFDQEYWAERAFQMGVAPRPIPRKSLDAKRLAEAMKTATADPDMHAQAEALAAKIRNERGVETAVNLVESYWSAGKITRLGPGFRGRPQRDPAAQSEPQVVVPDSQSPKD